MVLVFFAHGSEFVELSFEISLEFLACCDNFRHDFVSLLLGDSRSKWVISEVASNTDPCGYDHVCLIVWEEWGFKCVRVHVRNVLSVLSVSVILLNDRVEET